MQRSKVQYVPPRCDGAEVYKKYSAAGTQSSRFIFHTGAYFQLGVPNFVFTSQ